MRPIRLVMQAFGPYAERQELDMGALGETGIYAITGETGAGKTTIFDAIVFALYGSGSGEDRKDGRSLRSVAARPDLETLVELEFVSAGRRYTIARRPAQMLAGKRRGEPVEKPAGQKLVMPDGKTVYTKKGEIDEIVERDILGVTKDQFCQIVMIAQGEFRKLLQADTAERTLILRRIFKTSRYNALSAEMERRCKEKYAELSDSRRQASFSLNAMKVDAASPLRGPFDALRAVPANALLLDDAADMAERICRADEAEHREARACLRRAGEARDLAKSALERAKEQARKRDALSALRAGLAARRDDLQAARDRQAEAARGKPEIERLDREIITATHLLPRYGHLAELEARRCGIEGELAGARSDRADAEKRAADLAAQRDALAAEAETLRDASDRRLKASDALAVARDRERRLDALNARMEALAAAEEALGARRAGLRCASEEADASAERLAALVRERDALGNTELALTRGESRRAALEEAGAAIGALGKLLEKYAEERAGYEDALRAYAQREADAGACRREAEALRGRYNANIAGVWAQALADGAPCPVCGSTHHPHKATLAGEAVTEAEVDRAEGEAAEAARAFNAQALECSTRRGSCEGLRERLAEQLPGIPEPDWADAVKGRGAENGAALREAEAEIARARAADARFRRLRDVELPAAERARDSAASARNAADAAVKTAEAGVETARREAWNAGKDVLSEGWTALDLSDAIARNGTLCREHSQALRQAEADLERLAAIERRQADVAEALGRASEAIHEAGNRASALAAGLEACERQIAEEKKDLPYPDEEECRRAIDGKAQEKRALEEAIEAAGKAVDELSRAVAGAEGEIRSLEADLGDAPEADLAALEADFLAKQAAYEARDEREGEARGRRDNNADQRARLAAQAGAAGKLEREYRVMQDVSDTVRGSLSGTKRVPLETYVQTAYFDRIIAYANRRLIHMSRHQYDLARQAAEDADRRGKTGLELDVVDHANGQRRPVSTLSGGESFLASLSFALGMSDAIQASAASAVQLDTMFVDEGFGSLSENYLGLVMDELNDTANAGHRLIGVISHVDEVKEGIGRRIEVTKSSGGVSRADIL